MRAQGIPVPVCVQVDFFSLYSQLLNLSEVGVSLRRGGCFFSKRRWGYGGR